VAAPPEMPEEVRTGWVAKAGDAGEFAHAICEAFALDETAYRTVSERARHFAEYMFSPRNAVVATHAVYGALLAHALADSGEPVDGVGREHGVAWREQVFGEVLRSRGHRVCVLLTQGR